MIPYLALSSSEGFTTTNSSATRCYTYWMLHLLYAALAVCRTCWMPHLLDAALAGCYTCWMLHILDAALANVPTSTCSSNQWASAVQYGRWGRHGPCLRAAMGNFLQPSSSSLIAICNEGAAAAIAGCPPVDTSRVLMNKVIQCIK